jgi:hypothetical protein
MDPEEVPMTTQPSTGTAGTISASGASLSSGARPVGLADAVADEQVTPWREDGQDYGRDLGTGVPARAGTPEHQVDTPRTNEDYVASLAEAEETDDASASLPPPPPPGGSVVTPPLGQNPGQSTPPGEGADQKDVT